MVGNEKTNWLRRELDEQVYTFGGDEASIRKRDKTGGGS